MNMKPLVVTLAALTVVFATQHEIKADAISISDGSTSFSWNAETGSASLVSTLGGTVSIPSFEPMVRYTNFWSSTATRGAQTYSQSSGVRTVFVNNSASNSGNVGVMTVNYGYRNGLSSAVNELTATYTFAVSTTDLGGKVDYSLKLQNNAGKTLSNVSLFNYWDMDLASADSGSWLTLPDGTTGIVQEGGTKRVVHSPLDGGSWEVAALSAGLENDIATGGNLSNSGAPFGPGDMTAAFGNSLGSMSSGSSQTFDYSLQSIPEPSSAFVITLACVAVGAIRRRR
ncbi:MAG: hypothetical protein MK106_15730 [Mariniblastus sp.]|nr:hypothetical protein [Mariniblastus sp.]